jgi:hypothetical protein
MPSEQKKRVCYFYDGNKKSCKVVLFQNITHINT